eukprot:157378_1
MATSSQLQELRDVSLQYLDNLQSIIDSRTDTDDPRDIIRNLKSQLITARQQINEVTSTTNSITKLTSTTSTSYTIALKSVPTSFISTTTSPVSPTESISKPDIEQDSPYAAVLADDEPKKRNKNINKSIKPSTPIHTASKTQDINIPQTAPVGPVDHNKHNVYYSMNDININDSKQQVPILKKTISAKKRLPPLKPLSPKHKPSINRPLSPKQMFAPKRKLPPNKPLPGKNVKD